jgi:hypothetical protein
LGSFVLYVYGFPSNWTLFVLFSLNILLWFWKMGLVFSSYRIDIQDPSFKFHTLLCSFEIPYMHWHRYTCLSVWQWGSLH